MSADTPGPHNVPPGPTPGTRATRSWHHLLDATFRQLPASMRRSRRLQRAALRRLR